MKNNVKRLLCCILAAIFISSSVLGLTSCENSDIYKLIANIANQNNENDEKSYSFESNITFEFDIQKLKDSGIAYNFQESLDVIPKEMEFIVKGSVISSPLSMETDISIKDYEDISAKFYIKNNELFFELNEFSRTIVDIFWATGIIDGVKLALFADKIEYYNNTVLCFDITDFDLSYFDEYIYAAESVIKFDSAVKYGDGKKFTVPDYDKSKVIHFNDIQEAIKKDLLSIPGYRCAELACVINTENDINYINIIAVKETGEIIQLDRIQIDCDLSAVRANPELFETAEIIPLRYIFELLGKGVEWDEATETVMVFDYDKEVQCSGTLVKSKMYMSIANVESFDYSYEIRDIGEYIEFVIYSNDNFY